jgi:hypothetical protein
MDPQTINIVAATAVGILSSFLAKAGEAATKKVGEDIYQAVKARLGKKSATQETLTDLEKAPNDADFQAALRVQLRKLMAEDQTFAAQLHDLLQEAGNTRSGALIIQQVAGDNAKQFGQVFGNITFRQD